jgi:hypothetical protein
MLANLASFRQSFSALSTPAGQGLIGGMGLAGTSGAAVGAAGLTAAVAAVGAAFLALRRATDEVVNSFSRAAGLWARVAVGGGMAAGWQVQRANIAGIIGVSEQEVMRLGVAFKELADRTRYSSHVLAQSVPELTKAMWDWRVMVLDVRALFAQFGSVLSPVVSEFAQFVSGVVKFVSVMGGFKFVANELKTIFELVLKPMEVGAVGLMAFNTALIAVVETVQWALENLKTMPMRVFTSGGSPAGLAALVGMPSSPVSGGFPKTSEALKLFGEMIRLLFQGAQGGMPGMVPDIHRLPGSPWERMGLVIGLGGGGANYARDTAHNTKRTADLLSKISGTIIPRGGALDAQPLHQSP